MKRILITLWSITLCASGQAQDYSTFTKSLSAIHAYGLIADSVLHASKVSSYWDSLKSQKQIPLIIKDSVAFFYRGDARSVEWMGDFNAWGYNRNFQNKGKKFLVPTSGCSPVPSLLMPVWITSW